MASEQGKHKAATKEKAGGKGGWRLRKWRRRLAKAALVGVVLLLGLWIAIHRIPWLGPFLADSVRAVVGPKPVAWAENIAYGVQDRINRWRYEDEKPVTFWEVPAATAGQQPAPQPEPKEGGAAPDAAPAGFELPRFEPPFPSVASPSDGVWVGVPDPQDDSAPVGMYKTMVHPDKRRSFGVLAVIGIDVSAFDLHLVAGVSEPASNRVPMQDRPGIIPKEHTDRLFAAFNGGFKATHGAYGMYLDGVEYLAPRGIACTFIKFQDGSHSIGTWSEIGEQQGKMLYYRQTPPCLVEDGKIHSLLHYHEFAKGWGATISGDTVIRRSAIGLDASRKVLFYGLGDAMTAQAIARGMKVAGSHWVAELDVNYSYPRFLFYETPPEGGAPVATSAIIPELKYLKDTYVTRPSPRDFFYLTRKTSRKAAAARPAKSTMAAND